MPQPLLISFLGKNRAQPGEGYRTANYRIDDRQYETAYSGFALARHLRPARMLLLGTSGSMWDVLVEGSARGDEQEDLRLRLMEKVQNEIVDEDTLNALAPLVEQSLGCPVMFRVIPYARNLEEQLGVLGTISSGVRRDESVVLDITHGFRHLPMLGLVAAHFLERMRGARVKGLYYGALDMTANGETPVLNLNGLLRIMDWVQAFAAYDASGNYAPFVPLLAAEGWSEEECAALEQAAFHERTTNIVKARARLAGLRKPLGRENSPILGLFGEELRQRLSWWKGDDRAGWEAALARVYYDKGDYLRASILVQEACLSASLPQGDQNHFSRQREANRKTLKKNRKFQMLSHLRNAMAHGLRGRNRQVGKALKNETSLRATLGDHIRHWRSLAQTEDQDGKTSKQ